MSRKTTKKKKNFVIKGLNAFWVQKSKNFGTTEVNWTYYHCYLGILLLIRFVMASPFTKHDIFTYILSQSSVCLKKSFLQPLDAVELKFHNSFEVSFCKHWDNIAWFMRECMTWVGLLCMDTLSCIHGHTFLHSWSGPMALVVCLLHGATFLSNFTLVLFVSFIGS